MNIETIGVKLAVLFEIILGMDISFSNVTSNFLSTYTIYNHIVEAEEDNSDN